MELIVLILCIALVVVCAVALLSGGLKLKKDSDALKAESAKDKLPAARVINVKQSAGEVKIAYFAEEGASVAAEEIAVAEAAAEPAEEPETEPVDGVILPPAEKLTFEQRYARLPEEIKKLLDGFTAYIEGKEECGTLRQAAALAYRYKKGHIAKAAIRRDNVILTFPIANPELGRMIKEEKIKSVKMQPAEIRLNDEGDLALAKQTADISVEYLKQEEEYKAEKRKAARREAAKKKREEGDAE